METVVNNQECAPGTRPFRPGDEVVCVDAANSGVAGALTQGAVYVVREVRPNCPDIYLMWNAYSWSEDRFRSTQSNVKQPPSAKPRWSLMPWSALETVVRVLTFGVSGPHKANDWATNYTVEQHMDAAWRHMKECAEGTWLDKDSGQPHLSHAVCRLLFVIAMRGKS